MKRSLVLVLAIFLAVGSCSDSDIVAPDNPDNPGNPGNPGDPENPGDPAVTGPFTLLKVSGDGQTGLPGEALPDPYIVRVIDVAGGAVPEVEVRFRIATGDGGSITSSTVVTDSLGSARVTAWLPDALNASQTVFAEVDDGTNSLTFISFTTATIGGPAILRVVSGDGQKGITRDTLLDPLVVEVTNLDGIAMAGISVKWKVTSSNGGSVRLTPSVTDNTGLARNYWRVGNLPGATDSVIAWIEPSNADPDTVGLWAEVTGTPDTIVIVQGAIELDHIYNEPEEVIGDTVFAYPGHWARQPFKGIVLDADGRTVRGAVLTWTVTDWYGFVGLEPEDGEEEVAVTLNTAEDGGITVWRKACDYRQDPLCPPPDTWIGATLSIERYPDVTPITLDALIRE